MGAYTEVTLCLVHNKGDKRCVELLKVAYKILAEYILKVN